MGPSVVRLENLRSRKMNMFRGLMGGGAMQLRQPQDDQPGVVPSLSLVPGDLMFPVLPWGPNLISGTQEGPRPEKMASRCEEERCGWYSHRST